MNSAILNNGCPSTILVYQNLFSDNHICVNGYAYFCNADIYCNTFRNSNLGFFSFTGGTVPGFKNQGNTTVPAANVYTNVPNQLYAATFPTGSWTYYRASDENSNDIGLGIGGATINVVSTTSTIFQVCGTNTPGLRKEEFAQVFNAGNVKVFPNPFNEDLTIEFESIPESSYQLFITNLFGAIIESRQITSNSTYTSLNINNINQTGIYILRLQGEGLNKTIKIIKQ